MIKIFILVDLSAICLASPLSFLASPQSISVLFRAPIDLLLSCLGQTNQYSNKVSSFVRTSPLLVRLQKTLMTLAGYTMNQIFLEGF